MATGLSDINGVLKEVYAGKIERSIPLCDVIQRMVPFSQQESGIGLQYIVPVETALPQGFTYADHSVAAFDLNTDIPQSITRAVVTGFQVVLAHLVDYGIKFRTTPRGKKAFDSATELALSGGVKSHRNRLEAGFLYGQSGLGKTTSHTVATATTTTVLITTPTWAPGIWTTSKGATVNFWTAGGALISTGVDSVFTVVSANYAARTILVSGTAAGNTALVAAAAPLDIFYVGTRTGAATFNEMAGFQKVFSNTGSLFGIDAAVFDVWAGNTFAAGAAQFTFGVLDQALNRVYGRGAEGEMVCFVSPATWGTLNTDIAGRRQYDSSYKPMVGELGVESLKYHSINGIIEVVSHRMVKEGDAFLFVKKELTRVGGTDIAFRDVDGAGENFFFVHPTKSGYGLRSYSDQAIMSRAPSHAVYVSGIVN